MSNKSKRIDIRASEKELLRIDCLAARAKMSRSEYLITAALNKPITVIEGGEKIAVQLSKIGGNINQLKILAHLKILVFLLKEKKPRNLYFIKLTPYQRIVNNRDKLSLYEEYYI